MLLSYGELSSSSSNVTFSMYCQPGMQIYQHLTDVTQQ